MSTLMIFSTIVGFLFFLFFFWRRLKEDYSSKEIFTLGFYILIAGSCLSFGLNFLTKMPGIWFWGGVTGFLVALLVGYFRFKFRFFEVLEAATIGSFFWLLLIFFADGVEHSSYFSLGLAVFQVGFIILFFFLDSRYKTFNWYKSGKVGFSGLTSLALFFTLRSLIAIFWPNVLSFLGRIDSLVSAVTAFILFLLVYNLAQAKT